MKALYVVFESVEECSRISEILITEGLAKCINRFAPIESMYLWENKLERTQEIACLIKLASEKLDLTMMRIRELHTYDTPAVFEIQVGTVLPEYLAWINS